MSDTNSDEPMDSRHLRRPFGNRRTWTFRMETPAVLIGTEQPDRPGKVFGKEIIRCLGTRYAREAATKRDEWEARILGWVRLAEDRPAPWLDAMAARRAHESLDSTREAHGVDSWQHDIAREIVSDEAEAIEQWRGKNTTTRRQRDKADRFMATALNRKTLSEAHKEYSEARKEATGKWNMRPNTLIELRKTVNRLTDHMGRDARLEEVSPRDARRFVSEYMGAVQGPNGTLSRKTIASAVSYLNGLWRWAIGREYLPDGSNVWNGLTTPEHVGRDTSGHRRDPFEAEDWHRLAREAPLGTPLGDLMRIGLLTGARRGEIAALRDREITMEPPGFWLREGEGRTLKTANAERWVPLVGIAAEIVERRREAEHDGGFLFGDVKAKNIGDALGKRFKTVRDNALEPDRRTLSFHSFRHTFQTRARRADVSYADSGDVCGWTEGTNKGSGRRYDHGHDAARYVEIVERVVARYMTEGYITAEEAGVS